MGVQVFVPSPLGATITAGEIESNAVTTAKIADNAVTLGKLATGTDGELITWDSSGDPAAVAVGTSGHVLTSNGAGAAPTFQAAASGGAFTEIGRVVLTSDGAISFTGISTGFKSLVAVGQLRSDRAGQPTDGCVVELSTSSTFDTTASNYDKQQLNARGTTIDASAADDNVMSINGAFLGATATANAFAAFHFEIGNTTATAMKEGFWIVASDADGKMNEKGWIQWTNTNEIDGIRFVPNNGTNWVAGSFIVLYGI